MWSLLFASAISVVYLSTKTVDCRIFKRCELAVELKWKYDISKYEAAMFTCIAEKESSLNTSALRWRTWTTQLHGLFHVSDEYWCSAPGTKGYACGVACDKFRDDNIRDDFICARYIIYEDHRRISGDGFNAWLSNAYCKAYVYEYLSCFYGDSKAESQNEIGLIQPSSPKPNNKPSIGKVYEECELAEELHNKHNLSHDQIPTWVCIAQLVSSLNTSALGPMNPDGSANHGLFQISGMYWCGSGKPCGSPCEDFQNNDISDDISCIQKIYAEHGFNAWPTCNGDNVLKDCFSGTQNEIVHVQTPSPRPSNKPKSVSTGKVYEECELAKELHNKHNLSYDQIPTWVCIAQRVSFLNTSALGPMNPDGSANHGLFKISDRYWCGSGKPCGSPCEDFRDDDISDDISCIQKIYAEHGFNAWPTCNGDNVLKDCFSGSQNDNSPIQSSFPRPSNKPKSVSTGKVYKACELAEELYNKHNISYDQVAIWVCIAQLVSAFNTSAVGGMNPDGTSYHGLFQIGDMYWCGPGKPCGLSCEDLRDDDISDDVSCIKKIYAEHMEKFGEGFNAWPAVYPICRDDNLLNDCSFGSQNEIISFSGQASTPKPSNKPKCVSTGKNYTKCELTFELQNIHNISFNETLIWVCIAQHESAFDTSAVGQLNLDGSQDHGLFQISDKYWCNNGSPGKMCNVACEDLRDDDISDDVRCVKQIYEYHMKFDEDGFNAWVVYPRCLRYLSSYIADIKNTCFKNGRIAR